MTAFTIEPRGPFSLGAAADFIAGFPPAGRPEAARGAVLRLAFLLDGFDAVAGVALTERDGLVHGEVAGGAAPERVRDQVARILSLDVDGSGYAEVGRRDPVIGRLQERRPGLRPVLFHSPYEAAAWSVISARARTPQALAARQAIEREHGDAVVVGGERLATFPPPERLAELSTAPGLSDEKVARLRGVAAAALAGRLDASRLRGAQPQRALAELGEIRGIGPFYAALILIRGAGAADVLPDSEPRVRRAAATAYGLPEPPGEEAFRALAEPWRPYRAWVSLLLRASSGPG